MNLRMLALAATAVTALGVPAAHAATPYPAVQCVDATHRSTANDVGTAAATVVTLCQQGQGYAEIGATGTSFYVVVSGDAQGYVGVSNYESSAGDPRTCLAASPDGSEGGSGTNSGGCYGGNNPPFVDLTATHAPLPVCGDNTGDFHNTSRNGCRADTEDVDQALAQVTAAAACVVAQLALPTPNLVACLPTI